MALPVSSAGSAGAPPRPGAPLHTSSDVSRVTFSEYDSPAATPAFISGEIRAAHRLGIDIVQIDDGWQLGRSMNSGDANAPAITEGFYALDPNYWTVDPERFPNGLAALSQEAQDLGLELGLWFTPDPY